MNGTVKHAEAGKRAAPPGLPAPAPMNLMAREGVARDVPACYGLIRPFRSLYDEATWRALPGMWRKLIEAGSMHLFVVEDRARPGGPSLVACSGLVFVSDKF